MNVRTTRFVVLGFAAIAFIVASMAPSRANAAQSSEASASSGGQYKIGVVNRKQVLEKYNKVKAEYGKLQQKVTAEQTGIDAQSKKIEDMKKAYESAKLTMSPEDRANKEAEIQKEYSVYRSQLETKQREIDTDEQALMKKVFAEVDQVVEKIANAEGYHLVFEGGSGRGGVIYYSTTIDITQKVVDALNSGK